MALEIVDLKVNLWTAIPISTKEQARGGLATSLEMSHKQIVPSRQVNKRYLECYDAGGTEFRAQKPCK